MHSKSNLTPLYHLASQYLSDKLLDTDYSDKLDHLHSFLPQLNMVNYEFRLTPNDPRVDANIMVWKYEAPILFNWLSKQEGTVYRQLYKWVEDWMNPRDTFHMMIQNIWIMYDVKESEQGISEPWLVFAFSDFVLEKNAYITMIKRISTYFDNNYKDRHWSILERIYSHLDTGQSIPAFGIQNRNVNSIRLGVRNFSSSRQMKSYLEKISWPGNYELIEQQYAEFVSQADYSMLSITFNEELFPQLGIECYLNYKDNYNHSAGFLESLVDKQLSSMDKADALLNWIGYDDEPQPFFTVDGSDHSIETRIKRWLHEVKLVIEPNSPPFAKAYVLINQIMK